MNKLTQDTSLSLFGQTAELSTVTHHKTKYAGHKNLDKI